MKWERLVCATQDTYEVSLEHLDCFLSNIAPVVMWRDELVLHVVSLVLSLNLAEHLLSRMCIFGVTPMLQRQSTSTDRLGSSHQLCSFSSL